MLEFLSRLLFLIIFCGITESIFLKGSANQDLDAKEPLFINNLMLDPERLPVVNLLSLDGTDKSEESKSLIASELVMKND